MKNEGERTGMLGGMCMDAGSPRRETLREGKTHCTTMTTRHLAMGTLLGAAMAAAAQQPFDLDPTFRTTIQRENVSSILPTEDGKVWVSGMLYNGPGPNQISPYSRLNHHGSWDLTFPHLGEVGFFRKWNDQFYLGTATPRRYFQDGTQDTSFNIFRSPAYHALQGGEYFVNPDGGLLMGGVNRLFDSSGTLIDYYCLLRFTTDGSLDTTFQPRTCAGSLDYFTELPNGQFIGSGSTSIWDGQAASNIIRFNADGSLDPAFQANVWWGQAYGFLPLDDGRVYVGGQFMITGILDTLCLVRFMPDGSLDPTFDNTMRFEFHDLLHPYHIPIGLVSCIYPISDSEIIVTGSFDKIDDQERGSIALFDAAGNLLDDAFTGSGVGGYFYQNNQALPPIWYYRSIRGIVPAPDGSLYIYGAYHGYDDGTTNDTMQRFVSRLHGLNVGINEEPARSASLQIAPNPSHGGAIQLSVGEVPKRATLSIHDASGRVVRQEPWPAGTFTHTLKAGLLAPGTYLLRVQEEQGTLHSGKLVVLP